MPAELERDEEQDDGKEVEQQFHEVVLFAFFGLEVQRGGVHAIAQAGVGRAVGEDVAQVGAALRAHGFGAHHAVAAVGDLLDRARARAREKLGQPQPASNLVTESNSLAPQQMQ